MCLKEKETLSPPYSYHTFIFPFVWSEGKTRADFKTHLGNNWKKETFDNSKVENDDLIYNQYQYFNKTARNAMYPRTDSEDEVVLNYNYEFPDDDSAKLCYYVIKKTEEVDGVKSEFEAELKIRNIKLKLFNSNMGVFVLDVVNYKNSSEEFVNKVNDYGRRLFMPFSDNGNCSACADKLLIKNVKSKVYFESKLTQKANRICDPVKNSIVTQILFNKQDVDVEIEPMIDDRMFVACYYINPELAESFYVWQNDSYSFMSSAKQQSPSDKQSLANKLYRYIFVDAGSITCQSRNMIEDLFKKHVYDRWLEQGSISGITEYSLMTISNSDWSVLINNFLTEYVEMAILALAQRASLLNFERRLSDCTCGKAKIKDVHKDYLLFQSQLLLSEVTPQQQGIELYNMLRENLFIEAHAKAIEKQIQALYAQETSKNEKMENLILFVIAVIGVVGAVDQLCNWAKPPIHEVRLGLFFVIFIVLLFAYIFREKININFLK